MFWADRRQLRNYPERHCGKFKRVGSLLIGTHDAMTCHRGIDDVGNWEWLVAELAGAAYGSQTMQFDVRSEVVFARGFFVH